jgi:hypothetical protein
VNYLVNILYDNSKGVDVEVVLVIDVSKILEMINPTQRRLNPSRMVTLLNQGDEPLKGNPK